MPEDMEQVSEEEFFEHVGCTCGDSLEAEGQLARLKRAIAFWRERVMDPVLREVKFYRTPDGKFLTAAKLPFMIFQEYVFEQEKLEPQLPETATRLSITEAFNRMGRMAGEPRSMINRALDRCLEDVAQCRELCLVPKDWVLQVAYIPPGGTDEDMRFSIHPVYAAWQQSRGTEYGGSS